MTWKRWIILQVRQAQRLAMESLLYWVELQLCAGVAKDTDRLAELAVSEISRWPAILVIGSTVRVTVSRFGADDSQLDDLLRLSETNELFSILGLIDESAARIRSGDEQFVVLAIRMLLLCARYTESLMDDPATKQECRRGELDRISLLHWVQTLRKCDHMKLHEFLRHVFETLILSQHFTFAARRFDGQTQRLRIAIEEQGLVLLATKPSAPGVTGDRLASALSLMADCGLIKATGGLYARN